MNKASINYSILLDGDNTVIFKYMTCLCAWIFSSQEHAIQTLHALNVPSWMKRVGGNPNLEDYCLEVECMNGY